MVLYPKRDTFGQDVFDHTRKGRVLLGDIEAGIIEENENGYVFSYSSVYLAMPDAKPVSLILPLQEESYISKTMIPFFDGFRIICPNDRFERCSDQE